MEIGIKKNEGIIKLSNNRVLSLLDEFYQYYFFGMGDINLHPVFKRKKILDAIDTYIKPLGSYYIIDISDCKKLFFCPNETLMHFYGFNNDYSERAMLLSDKLYFKETHFTYKTLLEAISSYFDAFIKIHNIPPMFYYHNNEHIYQINCIYPYENTYKIMLKNRDG